MQDQIIQLLKQYGIINQLEQAHFLGQCAVESADFSKLTESPNYRYSTALKVFPTYKAQIQALQKKYNKGANDFVAQPDFFNLVYGARMGNQLNGTNDNDGWDYRGGGLLQLTGKANYQAFLLWLHGRGQYTNLTIDTIDDFVRTPIGATISAIWFWLANGVGSFARSDNVQAVSKLINVGNINKPISAVNGFAERVAKTNYFKKQFGLLQ